MNEKRSIAAALLLAGLALVTAQPREKVEVLVTEYPPFMGDGARKTLWCELAAAAFAREGVEAAFVAQPLERIKSSVVAGTRPVFLNSTLVITPAESPFLLTSPEPMILARIDLFYPKALHPTGFRLASASDLEGVKVGALRGTGAATMLAEAGAALELSNDLESLFLKLARGRLEMVAVADLTGLDTLGRILPGAASDYGRALFYSSPIDLVFSRAHPSGAALRGKFLAGLKSIRADGSFDAIVRRYYADGRPELGPPPPRPR